MGRCQRGNRQCHGGMTACRHMLLTHVTAARHLPRPHTMCHTRTTPQAAQHKAAAAPAMRHQAHAGPAPGAHPPCDPQPTGDGAHHESEDVLEQQALDK
jgi:hypothetical protein